MALKRAEEEVLFALGFSASAERLGSFDTLLDSMISKSTIKQKSGGTLNLTSVYRRLLILSGQNRSFSCNAIEDIKKDVIHDLHRSSCYLQVGINLFKNFVNKVLESSSIVSQFLEKSVLWAQILGFFPALRKANRQTFPPEFFRHFRILSGTL